MSDDHLRDLRYREPGRLPVLSYRDVVERWTSFGVVPELALAQLGLGRCSVAIGRHGDAVGPLQACRALFLELGMAPALADADDLLARATASSS